MPPSALTIFNTNVTYRVALRGRRDFSQTQWWNGISTHRSCIC